MKVLILSFYYSPDLCAGSFRTAALVEQLMVVPGIEIEVITTMPNRYSSFGVSALNYECLDNVTIRRINLPSHKSGMLDQINSFLTFYSRARKFAKVGSHDLVYSTSSRLFTAFLGARIANSKDVPLYLDIRDIFVDTIGDVLDWRLAFFLKPFLIPIEYYTFRSAKHINLVSRGFSGYFFKKFKKPIYSWFTNGIDSEFLTLPSLPSSEEGQDVHTVLYAGNIGEGQGLDIIMPKFAEFAGEKYQFVIIGDGGAKAYLVQECSNVQNISMRDPVSREELVQEYMAADVLFLHLNDYSAFEKVLPSKIFEYAATGKPILAGVSGYAAEFIKSELENAEVFYPGDYKGALAALGKLDMTSTDRSQFVEKYTRKNIMSDMAASIVSLGSSK